MILAGRLIAVLLIAIPGVFSAYGWSIMRDVIFDNFGTTEPFHLLKFLIGFTLFICGVAFIGGFFVYKDKKKKQNKR
ncbi:MAG TPA: DUF2627 family protein [Bacillota bacterium]|nr:DUF2627 family protein [Bacillota bacterium]